jgi:hypothetical protein
MDIQFIGLKAMDCPNHSWPSYSFEPCRRFAKALTSQRTPNSKQFSLFVLIIRVN